MTHIIPPPQPSSISHGSIQSTPFPRWNSTQDCLYVLATLFLLLTPNTSLGRNSIHLGTETWPPYSYFDTTSAQMSGLSTEVIAAVFKKMGVTIQNNTVYPWVRAQDYVFKGQVDAVYTASKNAKRETFCYFPTEPIMTTTWVLFIHKANRDRLQFNKLEDLKGQSLGLIRGYNYPQEFMAYITENSKIEEVSFEIQNINKLIHNRYDYMPAIRETTLYLAAHAPKLQKTKALSKLYSFEKPLKTKNFYLMFSKKTVSKEFVHDFSKALTAFKQTQEYQRLLDKYLGEP